MVKAAKHPQHPDIVKRLKRAEGHLRAVVAMLEDGRECLDVAQQLHAVELAVAKAKKTLIHDHIDHCLSEASGSDRRHARDPISEFKEITKYL